MIEQGARPDAKQTRATIESYRPVDPVGAYCQEQMLSLIERTPDFANRYNYAPGHLTAQAALVNPDLKALGMMLHKKLNIWVSFGGHVDAEDESLLATALRETREESGIDDIFHAEEIPFDLDVHGFPSHKDQPDHYHFDVRFICLTRQTLFHSNEESLQIEWVPIADLRKKMPHYVSNSRFVKVLQERFG